MRDPNVLRRVELAAGRAVTGCLEARPAALEVDDLKLVAAGETLVCSPRVREATRPADWARGRERDVSTMMTDFPL